MKKTQTQRRENLSKLALGLFFTLIISLSILITSVAAEEINIQTYGETPAASSQTTQSQSSNSIDVKKYSTSYDFFSGALFTSPELCACSSFTDAIVIKNTGSFGAIFTISTDLPYAQIPINTVALEPQKSAELAIIINAPCGREDLRDYTVTIKSNLNREQQIKRTLTIRTCQTIDAALFANKNSILPCEQVNYTINITNPSSFTEEYLIEPQNFKNNFESQAYSLILNSGATGYVNTALNLDCSEYGNKTINFKITSNKNGLVANLAHALEVKQAYEFSAEIPENIEVCQSEIAEIKINLKNEAMTKNGYSLDIIDAPKFLSVEEDYLNLESGKSGEFKIISSLNDGKQKNSGIYKFKVRVSTDIGNNILEKDVSLTVKDCYTLSVTIDSENNPDVCSGLNMYNAVIQNLGSFTENISLNLNSSGFATLSDDSFVLDANEIKEIKIIANVPEEMNGKQIPLILSASLVGRQSTETWSDSLTLKAHDQYQCQRVSVENKRLFARYYSDFAVLKVKSYGFKESDYSVSIIPDDGKVTTDVETIHLASGEIITIPLNLSFNGTEPMNNYYDVIFKSSENDYEYKETVRIIVSDTQLTEKAYNYVTASFCKTVFAVLLIILLVAIIFFVARIFMRNSTYRRQGRFNLFVLFLIVVVAIIALIALGFPKSYYAPLNSSEDPLQIRWYEDSSLKIDLSTYFNDPDQDVLVYEALDEPENIDVSIEGSIVTFTPEKDWFGDRRIRFKVTDPDGESAVSERITLEVIDKPELDRYTFHTVYCQYINIALIIIILLVIMATPWRKKPKDENKVAETKIKKEKGYLYYIDSEGDVARTKARTRVPKPKKRK